MSTLALLGGEPIRKNAFMGWPYGTEKDCEAILGADLLGRNGAQCQKFADRFCADNDVKYTIPVSNGTVSLELILRGLGIGYGDEVILPPYTFIATMSSIVFASATPVFADVDPGTYNISADCVEQKITEKTKAIVAVAVGGRPCDFDKLETLARKHNIHLIVDAAQAVGARFNGRSVMTYGVAASVSCQNSKNLTCGEGGIIATNNEELYRNICAILGIGNTTSFMKLDHGLTEMQAALLNSQYDNLADEIYKRSENAAYLDGLIEGNPFVKAMDFDSRISVNAYHLYLMRINYQALSKYGLTRDDFVKAVNAEGFPLCCGYNPLYAFDCTSNPDVERIIGRKIDTSPLDNCEIASYKEGTWFYHSLLLGTRQDIRDIANIITKVSDNIEDLRGERYE